MLGSVVFYYIFVGVYAIYFLHFWGSVFYFYIFVELSISFTHFCWTLYFILYLFVELCISFYTFLLSYVFHFISFCWAMYFILYLFVGLCILFYTFLLCYVFKYLITPGLLIFPGFWIKKWIKLNIHLDSTSLVLCDIFVQKMKKIKNAETLDEKLLTCLGTN